MSETRVRVRLVPKPESGQPILFNMAGFAHVEAKPALNLAKVAAEESFKLKLDPRVTTENRVETLVEPSKLEQLFGAKLTEKKLDGGSGGDLSQTTVDSFLTSETELQVPENLKDSVAFAYIPSPVQFYGLSAIAPKVSLYHLTLAEVVNAVRAGLCHRNGWTGRRVKVAMTDSGFANHPYFQRMGFNITRLTPSAATDTSGHGTGESANCLAVAPDVNFIGVKNDNFAAEALENALAENPAIVTNSWGWDEDRVSWTTLQSTNPNLYHEFRDIENIVNTAVNNGVVMIFSAGNGHRAFPGSIPSVISAGGVTVNADESLQASSYASSFVSQLYPGRMVPDFCGVVGESSVEPPLKGHIMLPVPNDSKLEGENLPLAHKKKGWGVFSGTSAAAPQIAGIAALMLSVNPHLTPAQVKSILTSTCRDVDRGVSKMGDAAHTGVDPATGSGLVDAFRACQLAEHLLNGDT